MNRNEWGREKRKGRGKGEDNAKRSARAGGEQTIKQEKDKIDIFRQGR